MLFTTLYAGFSGESVLLEKLYTEALTGERLDDDLEVRKGRHHDVLVAHPQTALADPAVITRVSGRPSDRMPTFDSTRTDG